MSLLAVPVVLYCYGRQHNVPHWLEDSHRYMLLVVVKHLAVRSYLCYRSNSKYPSHRNPSYNYYHCHKG
jgi:hypothetical protein